MFVKRNTEVLLASGILASIAFVMASLLFWPPTAMDHLLLLIRDDHQNWLAWGMLVHAVMIVSAMVLGNCRRLRQAGLVLGSLCWLALFFVFVSVWIIKITAAISLIVSLVSFATLYVDVGRKPRKDCDAMVVRE